MEGTTYETHAPLVGRAASAFWRRYGGDWEELQQEACYHYARARNEYDPARSADVEQFVLCTVWGGLLDTKIVQARRARLLPRTKLPSALPARRTDQLTLLRRELGEDAAEVLALLQDPPAEMRRTVHQRDPRWGPAAVRAGLVDYLKSRGWCALRIAECFGEIEEAL